MKTYATIRESRIDGNQVWKRSDSDGKFHLTDLALFRTDICDEVYESLPQETHLESLCMSFNKALLRTLPSCRAIRSLCVSSLDHQADVDSLSAALLEAPFFHSLQLQTDPSLDLSSLPLSGLRFFHLASRNSTFESVSEALIRSKSKSLTDLSFSDLTGTFEPLANALLECPSLTNLHSFLTPLVQVLPGLRKLILDLREYTDESIEGLVSFLSQSAVQDLFLGTLSPTQLQLVADSLPSVTSLLSLRLDTRNVSRCEDEDAYLALFSALPKSPLRSLEIFGRYFRQEALITCLDKIPDSQLTLLNLDASFILAPGFDPNIHDPDSYEHVAWDDIRLDWTARFSRMDRSRFCLLT
jgi:hypothetical protein